jgi:ribosomal protein L37E
MWTKRTPAEIVEVRRERRRHSVKGAIFFGVLVTVGTTLAFGGMEAARRGRFFVPVDELLSRLLMTLIFGIVAGLLDFGFRGKKPTVVCPKCGKADYAGDTTQCSCGGRLEDIEEMKWV